MSTTNADPNSITIVYVLDNKYAPMASVSLASAISSANDGTVYDFCLFVPEDFSEQNKEKLKSLEHLRNDCTVSFVPFESMGKLTETLPHWHEVIFYKFFIPEKIPKKKCIYLDSDTIISQDLTNLSDLDLGQNCIGGVTDINLVNMSRENFESLN